MKKLIIILIVMLSNVYALANSTENENITFSKDTLIRVESNAAEGFNFPYFIFIPSSAFFENETTLLIEPNNTGFPNDTLQIHEDDARNVASNKFYTGNYVSGKLGTPLLVPVFPRPLSDWKTYTHAFNRTAAIAKGDIKRLDLQLIAMINDAKEKLKTFGIKVDEKVFLTGFSASGTFVNRFALIHPEIIKGYAIGGINGILMLPTDHIKNERLLYPIGTFDFKTLFHKEFQANDFIKIPQFIYMGEIDDNDAAQFDDSYNDSERKIIYKLLGKEMMPKRWNNCQKIYQTYNVNATFKTYTGIGHKMNENIKNEITDFFRNIIDK